MWPDASNWLLSWLQGDSDDDHHEQDLPDFSGHDGLGSTDVEGFPAEGELPEDLPLLSAHCSTCATILREGSSLYRELRSRQTALGVGLGRCIKASIDDPGHHLVVRHGVCAGDEKCYEVFCELFDPVISRYIGDESLPQQASPHRTDMGRHGKGLTTVRIDPAGKYVQSSHVCFIRNLSGFRFPSAMSLDERCEVERLVAESLLALPGSCKGQYFPLRGSNTISKRSRRSSDDEDELRLLKLGLLFPPPEPTSDRLFSGSGRDWPHGRGVFVNEGGNFSVRVNDEDHIRVSVMQHGDAMQLAFRAAIRSLDATMTSLRRISTAVVEDHEARWPPVYEYARSHRLGFLTSSPANVGTAMRATVILRLPQLARYAQRHRQAFANQADTQEAAAHEASTEDAVDSGSTSQAPWRVWCSRNRVHVLRVCNAAGRPVPCMYEFVNMDHLGVTEVESVNLVIKAVACIVKMEQRLEQGESIDDLLSQDVGHLHDGILARRSAEEVLEDGQSSCASPRSTSSRSGLLGKSGFDSDVSTPPVSPLPRHVHKWCEDTTCLRCRRQDGWRFRGRLDLPSRGKLTLPSGRPASLLDVFNVNESAASSSASGSSTLFVLQDTPA